MKVLLTGSSGFLGRIIYNQLTNSGIHEVYTLSRTCSSFNTDLSKEVPQLVNVDLVIHAAGKAHSIPKNESEIKSFFDVNTIGTSNLLAGISKLSTLPKAFVFISSVSVYGCESGDSIKESYPLKAKDPYGLSKIKAEKLVSDWCNHNDVICSILRLPLLVGENPPGNLGSMIKAISKGYYFNIGDGSAKKSMILAHDVANFIRIVHPKGGIYNLTDGYHPTFNELSLAISKIKNKSRIINIPFWFAKILGLFGDFFGTLLPINSMKVKKMISNLTFDDTRAREKLDWNSNLVIDFIENKMKI